jgi:hypothetical protein
MVKSFLTPNTSSYEIVGWNGITPIDWDISYIVTQYVDIWKALGKL